MENKERIGRRRLHIDLPKELHQQLKLNAVKRNVTLTKIVCRLIVEYINKEKQYE